MKLAGCKSALNPPVVYSTDRSKALVPVLFLLFAALWFILRGDLFYVLPCAILLLCFSVLLGLRLPRLGGGRANLSVFRTFVRFMLVWFCRFSLPFGVWEGLLFVFVAFLDFCLTFLRVCLRPYHLLYPPSTYTPFPLSPPPHPRLKRYLIFKVTEWDQSSQMK